MMNERFSDLLIEYLEERERQNSDYYDYRYIGSRGEGAERMSELTQKMDVLIHGVEE
jgi:predicted CopG family antitoxin